MCLRSNQVIIFDLCNQHHTRTDNALAFHGTLMSVYVFRADSMFVPSQ